MEKLKEDTVKTSDGKWTNKGDEGTHGKFKTKKEADAQRKAMFANGYHESCEDFEQVEDEDKEAFKEEFGDDDDLNIDIEDYEDILDDMRLESRIDKLQEELNNELFAEEESEEDEINRKADEVFQKRWAKVYETYCGCVRKKYGEVDELNLPLDEDLLDSTSCYRNYDKGHLKANLIKSMKELTEKWLEEGKVSKYDLAKSYAQKVANSVCEDFERNGVFDSQSVYINVDDRELWKLQIWIYNVDLSHGVEDDLSPSDEKVLNKFVQECVNDFISNNEYPIAERSISLKETEVQIDPTKLWWVFSPYYYGSEKVNADPHQKLCIYICLRESHAAAQFAGDSIADVANGIGKFTKADSLRVGVGNNNMWVDDNGWTAKGYWYDDVITVPIEYKRQGLSYQSGFKFWDRFTKLGKGMTGVYKHSSIKLAAEYKNDPDIILMWVVHAFTKDEVANGEWYRDSNIAVLLHKADFEKLCEEIGSKSWGS